MSNYKIVVGDVHGMYDPLMELIEEVKKDNTDFIPWRDLVFVGDVIDRGPHSSLVLDYIVRNNCDMVLGNHEDMLLECMQYFYYNHKDKRSYFDDFKDPFELQLWFKNGGLNTLESYGYFSQFHQSKFNKHIEYLKRRPIFLHYQALKNEKAMNLLVTHSAACDVWSFSDQRRKSVDNRFKNTLLWGRPYKLRSIPGVFNIYGHDTKPAVEISYFHANVDTGAVYKEKDSKLTAVRFPEMTVYQVSTR